MILLHRFYQQQDQKPTQEDPVEPRPAEPIPKQQQLPAGSEQETQPKPIPKQQLPARPEPQQATQPIPIPKQQQLSERPGPQQATSRTTDEEARPTQEQTRRRQRPTPPVPTGNDWKTNSHPEPNVCFPSSKYCVKSTISLYI